MMNIEAEHKKYGEQNDSVKNFYDWLEALITALIIVSFLFSFVFRVINVSGPSMLPNFHSGDRVLLESGFYNPKQGDVVVITHTRRLSEPIIKRVIATGGQTVDIDFKKGVVSVDGKQLDESIYIENGITTQPSDYKFPVTVPKGCIFVLGDNREVSDDSRSKDVGMVDKRYVLGKAKFIIFPTTRFGAVK